MGAVYLAEDLNLNSLLALKEIRVDQPELRDAFKREAQLLANLRHHSLPKVIDYFSEGDCEYLAMEYIPGEDLGALLEKRGRAFSQEEVLPWAFGLLDALEYLHRHEPPIIHRDIKPQNLKLTREGGIILLDFGLAKGKIAAMTTAVSLMGYTPGYAPLEQIDASGTDAQTDIYALSATLYHLVTATPPPPAVSRSSGLIYDSHDPLISAANLSTNVSVEFAGILVKGMAMKRAERFASAAKMSKALKAISERTVLLERDTAYGITESNADSSIANTSSDRIKAIGGATMLGEREAPEAFFSTTVRAIAGTRFFEGENVRYTKIQETLTFYRDHLNKEYQNLSRQANLTYNLWLCCVGLGFVVVLAGFVLLLFGQVAQSVAAGVSTALLYFIQRVFQQREDHYRRLASTKNSHLEYGNQWLLVIQSIDAIEDPNERMKKQARLVAVLTEKLKAARSKE